MHLPGHTASTVNFEAVSKNKFTLVNMMNYMVFGMNMVAIYASFHADSYHFSHSSSTSGEAACGAHVFEGFFGLENGPVKSDKSQEKALFDKDFPKPAKTQS